MSASAAPAPAPPLSASVVICTFNRADPLRRAVRSARAQALPQGWSAELVVVDNSPDANARPIIADLTAEPGLTLHYLSAPQPNIALARNAGVAASASDWVVFLDDDEWCEPGWLAALLATAQTSATDVVFGVVLAEFPGGPPEWDPSGRPYERRLDAPTGTMMGIRHDARRSGRWVGTGNSALRRASCLADPAPFDPRFGRSGGEDYDLFVRLAEAGRRMVWCAEAVVHELVPPDRASFDYMLRRSRRGGQLWAVITILRARHRWLRATDITARALVQWTLLTLGGGGQGGRKRARALKLASARGKLIWWRALPGSYQ